MEQSARGQHVTEQVALWVCNDSQHCDVARGFYKSEASLAGLTDYLIRTLRAAAPYSAAWYVAQELSPADYSRIDWGLVADQLSDDD
jgi:hypothetical protein